MIEEISSYPLVILDRQGNLPFDVPESIKSLARRPRLLKLLRRPFLSPFPPRSSLLRWITGVSAVGSATLVPAGGCSGELYPFVSSAFALGGRPFLGFLASGWCSGLSRLCD